MGHKQDLLVGAKTVLAEKGYANATARDVVAASATNLASIGYHYGSLDALLTQAMIEMIGEWGAKFGQAAQQQHGGSVEERFTAVWAALFRLFDAERSLTQASLEISVAATRSDVLKQLFAAAWGQARAQLPDAFLAGPDLDPGTRRAVGGLLLALINGVTVQVLLDPDGAPTAEDLTLGLRAIGQTLAAATSDIGAFKVQTKPLEG